MRGFQRYDIRNHQLLTVDCKSCWRFTTIDENQPLLLVANYIFAFTTVITTLSGIHQHAQVATATVT